MAEGLADQWSDRGISTTDDVNNGMFEAIEQNEQLINFVNAGVTLVW